MGSREYQIVRTQRDHKEEHDESSIGPCSLLKEVHDERMDMQVNSRKGDRTCTSNNMTRDRVKIVGAVPVFDRKDETIIIDHAYNKRIQDGDREIVEQHHDRERNEHKRDKVLFGLFTGDHKERNITRDVMIDGKLNHFQENSSEHKVKFLGITIAHTKHLDNDDDNKPRRVQTPRVTNYYDRRKF